MPRPYEGTQIDADGSRRRITASEPEVEIKPSTVLRDHKIEMLNATDVPEDIDPVQTVVVNTTNVFVESTEDETVEDETEESEPVDDKKYPHHVGRGVYELRSGERVKGKAAALEAQALEDQEIGA